MREECAGGMRVETFLGVVYAFESDGEGLGAKSL